LCGIAGWVDFERDLTPEGPVLRGMIGALAARGPDDEKTWLHPRAALGVRRLSVVDLEGGSQPMICEQDGQLVAALAYTGEVFNFKELRSELEGRGHSFSTRSDTEVVLKSYVEWGPSCAERLNGMFAFAVWDARLEELVLIRDRVGVYPMIYAETPTGLLFGSEQKALLAHPLIHPTVGLDDLREMMSTAGTPDQAGYAQMRSLAPGQFLRAGRNGVKLGQFWSLQPAEHEDDLPATIGTVRELLEDIVARQLISDVPICTFLSGGLDSSALTALVSRELGRVNGGCVRTFALDFEGHAEHFQAEGNIRTSPDAPFAAEVAEAIGSDHSTVVVQSRELDDAINRGTVLRARDLPTPWGDLYTSLYLLCREVRAHSTVALAGDASDELFGGYAWASDQSLHDTGTFPWAAAAQKYPPADRADPAALLEPGLRDELDIDGYERDRYAEAVGEVVHLPGASDEERRRRENNYLDLTRYLRIVIDRTHRMGMAAGLESRVPFCDYRLLDYVYNVPWEMKSFDGREKSLLRAAVADLLPEGVLARKKAGYPVTEDPVYEEALRQRLQGLLSQEAPIRPLLDEGAVQSALGRENGSSGQPVARSSIEMVVHLNDWLKHYGVQLTI
jgi:asparagine synthase (glutamine-hydrolysing)